MNGGAGWFAGGARAVLVGSLVGLAAGVWAAGAGPAGAIPTATLYVNGGTGADSATCGAQAAPCRSIQQSLDNASAMSGAVTIDVAAGTYRESLVVSGSWTSLTLVGANSSSTVVAGIGPDPDISDEATAVVTLSNVTLSGSGGADLGFDDLSAPASLDNVVISGIDNPTGLGAGLVLTAQSGTPEVYLNDSTITGDTALGGAGILVIGTSASGAVWVHNSTLTGNSAPTGSAIYVDAGTGQTPAVELQGATVAGNPVTAVGHAAVEAGGTGTGVGVVNIWNSVVAGNLRNGADVDCLGDAGGSIVSGGHNLTVLGGGCPNGQPGDLAEPTSAATELGAVGDHGGPTPTVPLRPGSPAIGAGTCTPDSLPISADQRGAPRPHTAGQVPGKDGTCDIGAYQYSPPVVSSVSPAGGTAKGGTAVTIAGSGFTFASAVSFGNAPATRFTVVSDTEIRAVTPAGPVSISPGVDVRITNPDGTSPTTTADQYAYSSPGYFEVGSDGSVYGFGSAIVAGTLPALGVHVHNVVGLAPTADAAGYWLVGTDGGVFAFGDAGFVGSLPGLGVHVSDIVGIVPTADGHGYWMVGTDGGVFAFGDAGFVGSLPGLGVHASNVVGIVPTADNQGYWMVGTDGGVFAFGDAGFVGSLPGIGVHVSDVVGIVPTADGHGYWMVGTDGGVFAFGDAPFIDSLPGLNVSVDNIAGLAPTSNNAGYWMVGSDGGVFTLGDAPFLGSVPGSGILVDNIVSIVAV